MTYLTESPHVQHMHVEGLKVDVVRVLLLIYLLRWILTHVKFNVKSMIKVSTFSKSNSVNGEPTLTSVPPQAASEWPLGISLLPA